MATNNEPCIICEHYMQGVECPNENCPVSQLKAENAKLKEEIMALRWKMSYMHDPMAIGDRHEMGG